MPILDKPLVQYGVEEALSADMSEICFVTGRNKRAIEDHFDDNLDLDMQIRGKWNEASLDGIRDLMNRCTFAYTRQPKVLGPGHAVKLGKILTGSESFGVVLADDLCFGYKQEVLQQLVEVYDRFKCSVIAVQDVPLTMTDRYGIVAGNEIEDGLYEVQSLVEKPSADIAPSNLGIVGRYILTPGVHDCLEEIERGVGGEFQLTDALDVLAREERVLALRFQGIRFDCGSLEGFVAANNYCFQQRFGKLPKFEC